MGAPHAQPHHRPRLVVDHSPWPSDSADEVLAEFADEASLGQPADGRSQSNGSSPARPGHRRAYEIARTIVLGCLSAAALGASFAIGFGYIWSDRTSPPTSTAQPEVSAKADVPAGGSLPAPAPPAVSPGVAAGSPTAPSTTPQTPPVTTAPTPPVPTSRSVSPGSRRQAGEVATPNRGAAPSTGDDPTVSRTPAFSSRRNRITSGTQTPAASSKVLPSAPLVAPAEPSAATPAPSARARSERADESAASPTRPAATPVPTIVRSNRADINAVNQALSQYQIAYSQKNVEAMAGIWPTVDERGIQRAFAGIDRQALTLSDCRVTTAGNLATAVCDGRVLYVGRIGGRHAQERQGTWTIALQRNGEAWQFVRLNVTDGQSGPRRPLASPKP